MAIPTQFSVTSGRTSPIANPLLPQDPPKVIDAENVSIVDGAEVLASLSSVAVDTPSALTSETGVIIPLPSELTAQAQAPIDNAVTIPAESAASIDTPTEAMALSSAPISTPAEATALPSVSIATPSAVTSESVTPIDNASALPAASVAPIATPSTAAVQPIATIDTPTTATVQPSASIDTPSALPAENAASIDTPTEATSESAAPVATPSTLTTTTGTPTTPPFPLNHARILYNSILPQATASASGGVNVENTLLPNTWQRWTTSTPSISSFTLTYTFPAARNLDTICVGAHNVFGNGTDFTWRAEFTQDGGATWNLFSAVQNPTNGRAMMFHRNTIALCDAVRVSCTNVIGDLYVGFVSAGIALQMQRPFFNGHTPITDADVTQYYSNRSESGEIIGQQIRRQGYETSADWQNIDDTWYRAYFAQFKQSAKLRPFFFAWNLLEYPDDVGFCRIEQDISAPMQNGTVTKRSISMNLLGAG